MIESNQTLLSSPRHIHPPIVQLGPHKTYTNQNGWTALAISEITLSDFQVLVSLQKLGPRIARETGDLAEDGAICHASKGNAGCAEAELDKD